MPDLSNVYRPDRSMVQTVPGAAGPVANALPANSGGYGLDPNLLAQLVAYKAAQKQQQPEARAYAPAEQAHSRRDDMDEAFTQFMPDPTPRPKEAAPTRMRRVRTRSAIPIYGMDEAGVTYNDVQEHMLPDGSWSGDALYGTLSGNEAAARQRMATIDRIGTGGGRPEEPFPVPRESEHDRYAATLKRWGAR